MPMGLSLHELRRQQLDEKNAELDPGRRQTSSMENRVGRHVRSTAEPTEILV